MLHPLNHTRLFLSFPLSLGVFRKLFSHAATHNLRLIAVNMRDYPGSSPYTAAELSMLAMPDAKVQETVIRKEGQELAEFLQFIIKAEAIAPIVESEGRRDGGIVLVTWSMGNIFSMSLLGNAKIFSEHMRSLLETYLRKVVVYGA